MRALPWSRAAWSQGHGTGAGLAFLVAGRGHGPCRGPLRCLGRWVQTALVFCAVYRDRVEQGRLCPGLAVSQLWVSLVNSQRLGFVLNFARQLGGKARRPGCAGKDGLHLGRPCQAVRAEFSGQARQDFRGLRRLGRPRIQRPAFETCGSVETTGQGGAGGLVVSFPPQCAARSGQIVPKSTGGPGPQSLPGRSGKTRFLPCLTPQRPGLRE